MRTFREPASHFFKTISKVSIAIDATVPNQNPRKNMHITILNHKRHLSARETTLLQRSYRQVQCRICHARRTGDEVVSWLVERELHVAAAVASVPGVRLGSA